MEVSPQATRPAGPGRDRLDFLDGIRGGAALWVLLAHCMIWGGWYGLPLPNPKLAVDTFMVISGFLMVHGLFVSIWGGWLYRQPMLMQWRPVERVTLLAMTTLVGSYTVAWLPYRVVEKPGIGFGRRLLERYWLDRGQQTGGHMSGSCNQSAL